MRILGIDPGLLACGYAILEEVTVVGHGTIRPKRTLLSIERHLSILGHLGDLIAEWQPAVLAVEDFVWIPQQGGNPVVGRDAMCKLVGGVFALSLAPPYPILCELLPQSWGAQLLGGKRSHGKEEIAWAVNARLGTRFKGSYHDNHECDAVGLALVVADNIRAQRNDLHYARDYSAIRRKERGRDD